MNLVLFPIENECFVEAYPDILKRQSSWRKFATQLVRRIEKK